MYYNDNWTDAELKDVYASKKEFIKSDGSIMKFDINARNINVLADTVLSSDSSDNDDEVAQHEDLVGECTAQHIYHTAARRHSCCHCGRIRAQRARATSMDDWTGR